jgi:hypothetical protein
MTFPLRVSGNGRYLVDQSGRPFRLNAEAAWFFSTHASTEDVERYLDDRRRRGFTALVVMAMVHPGGYDSFPGLPPGHMATVPRNVHTGEGPLATPGDFRVLNEPYWRHVDFIIREAGERGMAVLLAYTYLGYQGGAEGWWDDVNQPHNDADVMFDFGRTLAQRYRSDPNIIWYPCGDYAPPAGSEGARRVLVSIAGIRDVLPDALFAAELNAPDDVVADHPEFAAVLDMESFYGFGPGENGEVYRTARRAWDASPPKPSFVCEPPYEGTPIGSTGSRTDIRRAEWYSVLGGGTAGQNFGTHGVWNVIPELFVDALDSPGTNDLQHQFALFASMPWWELEPLGGPGDALRHVAVAGTPDGAWLVAYVPPGVRECALDIREATVARWFNPTSGQYVDAPTLTTPGDNGTGEDDWVLVVTRPPATRQQ